MEGNTLRSWSGRRYRNKKEGWSDPRWKPTGARNRDRAQNTAWPAAGTYDGRDGPATFFNSVNYYNISSQTFLAHSTVSLPIIFSGAPPHLHKRNVIIVLLNSKPKQRNISKHNSVSCSMLISTRYLLFYLINPEHPRFTKIRYHWKECSTIYCWNRELLGAGSLCRAQQILNITLQPLGVLGTTVLGSMDYRIHFSAASIDCHTVLLCLPLGASLIHLKRPCVSV